jgi:hypothetical protein
MGWAGGEFAVSLLLETSTMTKITFLCVLSIAACFAQQPKFEIADVHVSSTAHGFAQNFGGVLRAGRYVNRDATLLNLIEAAYDVSEDSIAQRWRLPT